MGAGDKSLAKRSPNRGGKRRWLSRAGRSISASPAFARCAAWLAIRYLNLVYRTNRFIVEPADALDDTRQYMPVILAVWHGEHFLLPALRIDLPASVMISRNLDGEITARVVEAFGSKAIRASGGREKAKAIEKGGMRGFLEMLAALERGENVAQTADVVKGARRTVGDGIVRLAKKSGRPIVPLAVASSRRYVFSKAWDRMSLNLPFGRTAICRGEPVAVAANASAKQVEQARLRLEDELNRITQRAYELTGVPQ